MLRALLITAFLAAPAGAELRTWVDSTGQRKAQAELLEAKGNTAYLRSSSGKINAVPFVRLNAADQEYIRSVNDFELLKGEVIGIADGDTITILDAANMQHKVRLEGIDSPEGTQVFGWQSRRSLAEKIFQKHVQVEWVKKDRYDRTLGHVILDGRWLNKEQVAEGWTWHYKDFYESAVLAEAENKARAAKLGIWRDSNPIEPWIFRNPSLQARAPPEEEQSHKETTDPTVYVTRTGKRYHKEHCKYLEKSSIPIALSEAQGLYEGCRTCHPELKRQIAKKERPPREARPRPSYNRPLYFPSGRNLWGSRAGGSTYVLGGDRRGSGGTVNVRGYHRRDGTYVRPHTRRAPRR